MSKVKQNQLDQPILNSSMARQAILNGNFDVWQRGTSFMTSGVWTADRWHLFNSSSAFTVSQQDGRGVVGSRYCVRIQRNAGSSVTNTCYYYYGGLESIDGVKFRGKKMTLSFWARKGANYSAADSGLKVTVRTGTGTDETFTGGFYTTGNSNLVNGEVVTLTSDWQKFVITTPNVIASNATQLSFFFHWSGVGTAGAEDYSEITQVQLCAGDVALPFMPKSFEEELRACQRYYEIVSTNVGFCGNVTSGTEYRNYVRFYAIKRTSTPTITWTSNAGINGFPNETVTFERINSSGFVGKLTANASISGAYFDYSCTIDAEL